MANKRRVYIIRHTHELPEEEFYSSLTKISKQLDLDLSYSALAERLRRAKERTGKHMIRLRDDDGNPIMVEVREIE